MPSDSAPDLTVSDQAPLASVTVDANQPVSRFWRDLLRQRELQKALVESVRDLASGHTVLELYDELDERDVPQRLWWWIRDIARGDNQAAGKFAALLVPRLGSGHSSTDAISAVAGLFDDVDASVAVEVTNAFFEDRNRQQQIEVLDVITTLAGGLDVQLVASRLAQAKLREKHRQHLPAVSDWQNTPRDAPPVADRVDQALVDLDPDGRVVTYLRELRDAPSQSRSYSELYAQATVSKSAVRQAILQLSDLGLVERFGSSNDRHVELLAAGETFLEELDAEVGRQETLKSAVSDSGKSSTQAVCSAQAREGGDTPDVLYETAWSDRARHAAAVGCSRSRSVTLVSEPFTGGESLQESKTKYISYLGSRDEVVVSVRASGGLQYITSLATALADSKLLEKVLREGCLDGIDEDTRILRDARNIGSLSDDALKDVETLRENLAEWGQEIEELTTDLNNERYDDRNRFRGEIMRTAHGLAGSIAHLFDAIGVDVIRDVRVRDSLDMEHLSELSKTIAISASIQSRYGSFAAYRQLFRTDAGQPDSTPTIDAADPSGHLVGSFVLRGSDVHRLREPLENRLSKPSQFTEEPEEFIISVPIREASREDYRAAVGEALRYKNLRLTDETFSVLHALSPSPYHTTSAICRALEKESVTRELRIDEVRTALSRCPPVTLCPDLPVTVGRIVKTLLSSSSRLTQTELAEAADVSTRSIRNHRDTLEGLGIVDIGAAGWRLNLSYAAPDADERYDPVTPAFLNAEFVDAIDGLLSSVLPPDRYGDPDDPVGSVLFWPPDPWRLVRTTSELDGWAGFAARLTGSEPPEDDEVLQPAEAIVEMGPSISQTAIGDDLEADGDSGVTA